MYVAASENDALVSSLFLVGTLQIPPVSPSGSGVCLESGRSWVLFPLGL